MKKVKYRVTGDFGNSPIGEIRFAYVMFVDGPNVLLYHPRDAKDTCASIEMAHLDHDDCFISSRENAYINIQSQYDILKIIRSLESAQVMPIKKNLIIKKKR